MIALSFLDLAIENFAWSLGIGIWNFWIESGTVK
jgi:hypothetical protein